MTPPVAARALAAAFAAALAPEACAVSLDADGRGQALIYPYYTVQSAGNNAFNTYLSIANHTAQAKALRLRVREARNSREVASFNLYLSPHDAWTAAIIPQPGTDAPLLITQDRTCTLPQLAGSPPGIAFQNTLYAGVLSDDLGAGLDRAREGWIEVIEMASLTGAMAAAVTHNGSGIPGNCAAVAAPSEGDIAAPTGGLSGTLTLINVASGLDFTVNAEALAELSTRSFYRPPSDSYPDLNAVEIEPVSVVVANGHVYRSTWTRAADAVSAVLTRSSWQGEFALDAGTRSRSEAVMTFPTRHHYFSGSVASAPFRDCATEGTFSGQAATIFWFNRETSSGLHERAIGLPPASNFRCGPVGVLEMRNPSAHTQATTRTGVLGADNRAVPEGAVTARADNGWFHVFSVGSRVLLSQASSTRTTIATGEVITGTHGFSGLPVVGFAVRTFVNGTLSCAAGACQGNYGGAFPLKYRRSISP